MLVLGPGDSSCATRPRQARRERTSRAPRRSTPSAFTLIELLVVIGIIAALAAILIPVIGQVRASSQSTACLANLRQIMHAFNLYANDNQQYLPPPSDPARSNESWESHLIKYLATRQAFRCPADDIAFANYLSSYDWRDTVDPKSSVAGKMLVEIRRGEAVFVFDALPEWHARQRINSAWFDGSAHSMDYQEWARDLEMQVTLPSTANTRPRGKDAK